ncbi:MAG TPA: formimidoylglutamase [Alcaligenaceae bacterium]|nr:formimidoylglutamase [Alcaligenaceae bacterium]
MHIPADLSQWKGRDDSVEPGDVRRLYQVVQAPDHHSVLPDSSAILGFACDAGVARNQGRIGARLGPQAVRRILAGLPAHHHSVLYDFGDVSCQEDDLEQAQALLGEHVARMLSSQLVPVVIGGGHEIAWGSFQGLQKWLITQEHSSGRLNHRKLLILNLDAHFDLRGSRPGSSGTPFDQIAIECQKNNRNFKYACWGVSRIANTPALFERAHALGADFIEDKNLQERHLDSVLSRLQSLLDDADDVYLTIDIDVLPASVAPGVSAPASLGVPLTVIESIAMAVKNSGKMRLADLAEFNPQFDIDGHTARAVARLVWNLMGPKSI